MYKTLINIRTLVVRLRTDSIRVDANSNSIWASVYHFTGMLVRERITTNLRYMNHKNHLKRNRATHVD